jgi:hypothetical protein
MQVLCAEQQRIREAIEHKLVEALDSGEPVEITPAFWQERWRVLAERLQRSGKAETL